MRTKLFKKLFSKKHSEKPVPPIPTMEEIINHLYDKALQFANDEIIKVIYSNDRSKRFILLKSEKGFYKYIYEEICVYDELDWEYFAFVENGLSCLVGTQGQTFRIFLFRNG